MMNFILQLMKFGVFTLGLIILFSYLADAACYIKNTEDEIEKKIYQDSENEE